MLRGAAIGLTGVFLTANLVLAHVAPAVRENNRYMQIAPLGDRIQLTYTIFYGQIPGLEMRARMDRDRSGQITDAEIAAFAAPVSKEVAEHLEVAVDGRSREVVWHRIGARLGEPTTSGGAFELVMVTFVCLSPKRDPYGFALRDRYQLPQPGEGELRLEIGPGIRVTQSSLSGAPSEMSAKLTWEGNDALVEPGYSLQFSVGPEAFRSDSPCREPQLQGDSQGSSRNRRSTWHYVAWLGAALVALAALAALFLWRRRRSRCRPSDG